MTDTWDQEDLDRAVILLTRIYPARSAALSVLDAVGLGQRPEARTALVVRELWERAIARAVDGDLLPDLPAEVARLRRRPRARRRVAGRRLDRGPGRAGGRELSPPT